MCLPKLVEIKFGLYLLACSELLQRLPDLSLATQTDKRFDYEFCLQVFEGRLSEYFLESRAIDLLSAAVQFGELIHSKINLFRDTNPAAARVFDEVNTAIRVKAPTWDYHEHLEKMHYQGRELARIFFSGSPYMETQQRLNLTCSLIVVLEDNETTFTPYNNGLAPMAYTPYYEVTDTPNVVKIRFDLKSNFSRYLSYPFFSCMSIRRMFMLMIIGRMKYSTMDG